MDSTYAPAATDEKQSVPDSVPRVFRSSARLQAEPDTAALRTGIVLRARRRRGHQETTPEGSSGSIARDTDSTTTSNPVNVAAGRSSTPAGERQVRSGTAPTKSSAADGAERIPKLRIVQRDRRIRRRDRATKESSRAESRHDEEKEKSEEQSSPLGEDREIRFEVGEPEEASEKKPEERSRERRERRVQIREDNFEKESEVERTEEKTRGRREKRAQLKQETLAEGQDPSCEEINRERRFPRREEDRSVEKESGIAFRTILSRRPGKSRRTSAGRRCPASSSTSSSSSVARRNSMTMDLQRLIDEVHARPAIWDQKNVNYHNRDVILKMWREIARACDVSTDVAKSKWKHLRDNFRNELKKTYRGKCDGSVIIGGGCAGLASEHDSKWVWFKSLFFLRDQMNSRVIGCGLPQNCGPGIQSSPDETQIEPQIDILEGHEQAHFDEDLDGDGSCQSLLSNEDGLHRAGMPPPASGGKLSRKRQLIDAIDDDYSEIERKRYESAQKRLVADQLEKDDTYHFLMSVRNPLKSLPLDRQMFVRLKIQELVYNEINSQNQHGRSYEPSMQDVKPPRTGSTGANRNAAADEALPIDIRNSTPEANSENAYFG